MPLRLLHTADWHLGHALHGLDRTGEHAAFLGWLLDLLERDAADALLVSGDVFDASNPPASAIALWYRFLADAWRRLPRLQVVVIGGNHDSAARLDAPHPLLDALGRLRVVGGLPRRDGRIDAAHLAIPLTDGAGELAAVVAAVPFLRPADLALPGAPDDPAASTRRAVDAALAAARSLAGGAPVVAMAHLYLAGGQVSELSERRIVGGNLHALSADLFPPEVAYAALGHLHLAQRVGRREHVRYAGSPIPLSFAERAYPHQVVRVDLDGAGPAVPMAIPVPRFRELRRIPEEGPRPLREVADLLAALPEAGSAPEESWPWLEVQVELPTPEPSLRSVLQGAVAGRAARLVRIAPPHFTGSGSPLADAAAERTLAELDPEHVFRLKWRRHHQGEPPAELVSAFHELLASLSADERAA